MFDEKKIEKVLKWRMIMDKAKCITALDSMNKDEIKLFLQTEPDLNIFQDRMLKLGNFYTKVDFSLQAEWLLKQSTLLGAEIISEKLERFLNQEEIKGHDVLVINGVSLEEGFELSNGIKLIPYTDLQNTTNKATYNPLSIPDDAECPDYIRSWLMVQKYFFNPRVAVPSAALICPNVSKPLFQNVDISTLKLDDLYRSRHNELLEACTCLTLAGPCSPTPMGMWWEPTDWIPYSLWYGGASGESRFDLINNTNRKLTESDRDKIQKIHHQYSQLSDAIKTELSVPIDRLNRAIRRDAFADKAIELGIVMEAIFLNDNDQGELSYRLRQRAAWMLGNNYIERKEIMKFFGELYNYRSKAVHTGYLPQDNKNINELLLNGINKVSQAIEKIISNKKWPDWNRVTLDEKYHID